MKKLLIIKAGNTLAHLQKKFGDFEKWILDPMNIDAQQAMTRSVHKGESLPKYGELAGIVISGSHDMLTDHLPWMEETAQWLKGAVEKQLPILGICFGHQLLAYALGGLVEYNPRGAEYGTVPIRFSLVRTHDALFHSLPTQIEVQASHQQAVIELPDGAVWLAGSDGDAHQVFRYGPNAWGVQFHPEFNAAIMRAYITENTALLTRQGNDPAQIHADCRETAHGAEILNRFARIVFPDQGARVKSLIFS